MNYFSSLLITTDVTLHDISSLYFGIIQASDVRGKTSSQESWVCTDIQDIIDTPPAPQYTVH
jgi:hypothetical protein